MEQYSTTEHLWVSIAEYSHLKNISVSTIRRYIKKNRIKYKEMKGKYYIHVEDKVKKNHSIDTDVLDYYIGENEVLRNKIKKYQEEIDELKMLISIYEKKQILNF